MKKTLLSFAALPFLALAGAFGAVTEVFTFNGLNQAVPDGNPAGLAHLQTVTSSIATIESVKISLFISGAFNGDLYVYVAHDTSLAVLLNRPGTTAANAFGYSDSGVDVGFDDAEPASRDIHTYQSVLIPPPGTPLTGTWQPDGRNVDPNIVTDASARTALLSVFTTQAASGDWTLFVADLAGGDAHTLGGWTLTITGEPIPEPATLLFAAATAALALFRRQRPHG